MYESKRKMTAEQSEKMERGREVSKIYTENFISFSTVLHPVPNVAVVAHIFSIYFLFKNSSLRSNHALRSVPLKHVCALRTKPQKKLVQVFGFASNARQRLPTFIYYTIHKINRYPSKCTRHAYRVAGVPS